MTKPMNSSTSGEMPWQLAPASYANLRYWFDAHGIVISAGAIILNVTLPLLAITEKNRILRDYSKIILVLCGCDLCFAVFDRIFQHIIEISDGHIVFMVGGFFAENHTKWRFAGYFLWFLSLMNSAMMIPLVFVFRYYLIVKEKMMSTKKIAIFFIVVLLNAIHQAVMWSLAVYETEQSGVDRVHLLKTSLWTPNEVAVCFMAPLESGLVMYVLSVATFHDTVIYGIVIYCSVAIFRAMNSRDLYKMSSKSAETQRQMNRMLVMQMCLPVVCVMMPLTSMVSMGLLRIDVPGAGLLVTAGFSWLPFLSPLTTIVLVSNFRLRVLRWILSPLPMFDSISFLRSQTTKSLSPSRINPSTSFHHGNCHNSTITKQTVETVVETEK